MHTLVLLTINFLCHISLVLLQCTLLVPESNSKTKFEALSDIASEILVWVIT